MRRGPCSEQQGSKAGGAHDTRVTAAHSSAGSPRDLEPLPGASGPMGSDWGGLPGALVEAVARLVSQKTQ